MLTMAISLGLGPSADSKIRCGAAAFLAAAAGNPASLRGERRSWLPCPAAGRDGLRRNLHSLRRDGD